MCFLAPMATPIEQPLCGCDFVTFIVCLSLPFSVERRNKYISLPNQPPTIILNLFVVIVFLICLPLVGRRPRAGGKVLALYTRHQTRKANEVRLRPPYCSLFSTQAPSPCTKVISCAFRLISSPVPALTDFSNLTSIANCYFSIACLWRAQHQLFIVHYSLFFDTPPHAAYQKTNHP